MEEGTSSPLDIRAMEDGQVNREVTNGAHKTGWDSGWRTVHQHCAHTNNRLTKSQQTKFTLKEASRVTANYRISVL